MSDNHEKFEAALEIALGDWIRASQGNAEEMWSALANIEWLHVDGDEAGYGFRAAGWLIAEIRGGGDYMDWYCSGPYAVVSDKINDAMLNQGWSWAYYE